MSKNSKGLTAGSYKSVGRTHDGITILKPKTKPSHFTTDEIRSTIKKVLLSSSPKKKVPPSTVKTAKAAASR